MRVWRRSPPMVSCPRWTTERRLEELTPAGDVVSTRLATGEVVTAKLPVLFVANGGWVSPKWMLAADVQVQQSRVSTHGGVERRLGIFAARSGLSWSEGGGVQGAVGAGIGRLGLTSRPTDIARLQAVASVGQSLLVEAYERSLEAFGRHAAQILLTAEDLEKRTRYLNARNTIRSLLEIGAVPVINENDTVAVDELMITFGDNDRLAAIVTLPVSCRGPPPSPIAAQR